MLLSLIFLLIVGSGSWSLDRWLVRRRHPTTSTADGAR